MTPTLTEAVVELLRSQSAELGFARLGVARLDDPRLERSRVALAEYDREGRAGEMTFMTKTMALRRQPELLLPGARTAIVGLVPHDGEPGPVARYAQFFDYHTDVHRRLLDVAALLSRYVPGVETLVCVDTKPVPERALAVVAGLGFIGKNGCLIAPGLGSQLVIGVLLTTAALEDPGASVAAERGDVSTRELTLPGLLARRADGDEDAPTEASPPWEACGRCRACLDACPTQAFVSPGVLDPRRCVSYLTIEHRSEVPHALLAGIGERVAGCDACQEVCPYNRGSALRLPVLLPMPIRDGVLVSEDALAASDDVGTGRPGHLAPAPRARELAKLRPHDDGRAIPSLAELVTIRNRRYKAFVKHSPVDRIPRRTMQRNALIALGNRIGPLVPEEARALAWHLLRDDEELRRLAARAWERRTGEGVPDPRWLREHHADVDPGPDEPAED